LKQALNVVEKNNRTLNRLEARYKAVNKSSARPISEHSHDEIKRQTNQPEIEQTTNPDIEETAEITHKSEESNA
jgi:hypothetical protein